MKRFLLATATVWLAFVIAIVAIVIGFLASPTPKLHQAKIAARIRTGDDPRLTVDLAELRQSLECFESRIQDAESVLLVHGTGSNGSETWDHTLRPILQDNGYRVCQVSVPDYLFGGTPRDAEFIVHALQEISKTAPDPASSSDIASERKPITVISWSSGGLITQWALTFFPSARQLVKQHIALGPPHHGNLLLRILRLFKGVKISHADTQTMSTSKAVLARAAAGGSQALVPTIAIVTAADLFIQPAFDAPLNLWNATWRLDGPLANHIDVQRLCGLSNGIILHQDLLWSAITVEIILRILRETSRLTSIASIANEHARIANVDKATRQAFLENECRLEMSPLMSSDGHAQQKRADIMGILFERSSRYGREKAIEPDLPSYASEGR